MRTSTLRSTSCYWRRYGSDNEQCQQNSRNSACANETDLSEKDTAGNEKLLQKVLSAQLAASRAAKEYLLALDEGLAHLDRQDERTKGAFHLRAIAVVFSFYSEVTVMSMLHV